MRVLERVTLAALAALLLRAPALAEGEPAPGKQSSPRNLGRWDDTDRFYLLFQSGFNFQYDNEFAGNVHDQSHEFPPSSNWGIPIGMGLGYNFSKHFGVELQGVGTEPDVRSDSIGKLAEY